MNQRRSAVLLALGLGAASCTRTAAEAAGTGVLHLAADGAAVIESAGAPESAHRRRRWDFAEPRPEWETLSSERFGRLSPVARTRASGAVRLTLEAGRFPMGGLRIDLGELVYDEWETVVVEARTSDRFGGVTVMANVDDEGGLPGPGHFFQSADEAPPMFSDGSAQRYAIPLQAAGDGSGGAPESLRSLSVIFAAPHGPVSVEVASVELVPRGAAFLEDSGSRNVARAGETRHALFAHVPATVRCPVDAGAGSRLDFALTVDPGETVTYRVRLARGDGEEVLFEETVDDATRWRQRSVPLADANAATSGPATLVLEAESEQAGAVALWGAPMVSSTASSAVPDGAARGGGRPNVLFYVIDGGDADLMSLYEYDRPTTPFLERLAEEGVLFTRAHSNSTWTQPSTVSFMTSLHHSVLGGLRRGMHSTSVPAEAVTLAEHFRHAGYPTASFTANPNAGRIIGIDRGMDLMRDTETTHHSTSSIDLHRYLFEFRAWYPCRPWFAHLQTTDVHEPNQPEEPYAGMFLDEEGRERLDAWEEALWRAGGADFGTTSVVAYYDRALERAGIDRKSYYGARRDLYDETMVHQDHALEELVQRLKDEGEWESTIFVLGADHGHPAGTFARFGRGLIDPQPEPWQGAMCDAWATRVPLLVIWPARIEGGRRIDEPVSMLDVLPTLLELADLPRPEVAQGHSLAPLLLGEEMELPPVVLDEFRVDEATGEMIGNLEIVDGRWGASLEIGPTPAGTAPSRGRRSVPAGGRWGAVHPFFPDVPRLLLYDLETDPFTAHAVNDAHPELVEHYTELLRELWEAHRALALRFGPADGVDMTPEQLDQLRALGYIR